MNSSTYCLWFCADCTCYLHHCPCEKTAWCWGSCSAAGDDGHGSSRAAQDQAQPAGKACEQTIAGQWEHLLRQWHNIKSHKRSCVVVTEISPHQLSSCPGEWWAGEKGRREGKALEKCSDPVPMLEQTYIQWKHTVSRSLMLGQKKNYYLPALSTTNNMPELIGGIRRSQLLL